MTTESTILGYSVRSLQSLLLLPRPSLSTDQDQHIYVCVGPATDAPHTVYVFPASVPPRIQEPFTNRGWRHKARRLYAVSFIVVVVCRYVRYA